MSLRSSPRLRSPRAAACGWLLATLLLPAAAPLRAAEPTPLDLDEALRLAEDRAPLLAAARLDAHALREQAVAAARLPDPTLMLALSNLPVTGPERGRLDGSPMGMAAVGLAQTWIGRDKRAARSEGLAHAADAAQAEGERERLRVRIGTARAWLTRHFRAQALERLLERQQRTRQLADAVEAAYRSGRRPLADALLARAEVARMEDRVEQARTALANARVGLERWIGPQASRPPGRLPDLDRLAVEEALVVPAEDPEVAVFRLQEQVAQSRAEQARLDRRPDWSWSLMYGRRDPAFGDVISLNVAVPLPWDRGNRQDRELAAALDRLERTRHQTEDVRRAREAQIRSRINTWRSQLARLALCRGERLALAEQRVVAMEAAFRGNQAPLADYLDAQRQRLDQDLECIELARKTAMSWAELAFLPIGPVAHATTPSLPDEVQP